MNLLKCLRGSDIDYTDQSAHEESIINFITLVLSSRLPSINNYTTEKSELLKSSILNCGISDMRFAKDNLGDYATRIEESLKYQDHRIKSIKVNITQNSEKQNVLEMKIYAEIVGHEMDELNLDTYIDLYDCSFSNK